MTELLNITVIINVVLMRYDKLLFRSFIDYCTPVDEQKILKLMVEFVEENNLI